MLPKIWIFDTYTICILIGVALGFLLLFKLLEKRGIEKKYIYDVLILACFTVIIGFGCATLAQIIIDALNENNTHTEPAMTFYGGLIGGIGFFIAVYFIKIAKKYPRNYFTEVYKVAPAVITLAHAFGRIGCFMAGCCYGIKTDSFLGVTFPGMSYAVYPTQLFEAVFLFVLTIPLAFNSKSKYNMNVYLYSYGVWRFLIEFIRGDEDRGAMLLSMSPAQWISIAMIIASTIVLVLNLVKDHKKEVA